VEVANAIAKLRTSELAILELKKRKGGRVKTSTDSKASGNISETDTVPQQEREMQSNTRDELPEADAEHSTNKNEDKDTPSF